MAQQGLFTQGPSVDDILQKRNKYQYDMQQQLMNQAAQGARDPAKMRAVSLLGSSLGRALGGSMDDGANGREALEAKAAQQQDKQASFMAAVQSNNSATQFQMAKELQETYPAAALQMLQIGQATEGKEASAKQTSDAYVALQGRAATVGDDLSTWNPELAYRLVSGNATKEEYAQGVKELTAMNKKSNGGDGAPKGWTFNDGGTYVDGDGNRYILTNSINKDDGKNKMAYTPVGNAPAYTNAALEPVDSTGMSQDQRIAEKLAKVKGENEAKKFYNHQEKAGVSIGQTTTNLRDARRMSELLQKVNTGGQQVLIGKGISDFFGTTPTSVSELDTISKTMMLSSLKSLLGGQLSDGERKAAQEVQVALEKGVGANQAIVDRYITIFESKLAREQHVLGNTATGASYRQYLIDQSMQLTAQPAEAETTTVETPEPLTMTWVRDENGKLVAQ